MKLNSIHAFLINDKSVALIALVLSCIAFYFSYTNNLILTYNDAASHLNIARRVIDNLTPGLAQIGTVWLPLPHVFMLPFAWNDFLWHTGFAGSIVSMAAFIVSTVFTFKTIYLITKSRFAGLIGALIMAINPNFLYLQTTPMTEPLLIATFTAAVYYLAKYMSDNKVGSLVMCSVAVAAATLIRYDGWFLFAVLAVLIPVWITFLKGRSQAEGIFFLFIAMGGAGIIAWLLWNFVIFGDPLYFITGPYSAYAQQKVLKSVGQLPTEGNIFNATFYYLWSVIDNNGLYILAAAAVGSIITFFTVKEHRYIIVFIAAFSPILFNAIALYMGQSAMNVPQAPDNPGMFNIRYGLMALPFVALVLGSISSNRVIAVAVILLVSYQSFIFYKQGTPVALADGLHGLKATYYTVEASHWLRDNYDGGLILTSLASHDAFVARAQIPMRNYIHEGTREYWSNALDGPEENIKYVAMLSFPPDIVYKSIANNETFKNNYTKVHSYGKFAIYKLTY